MATFITSNVFGSGVALTPGNDELTVVAEFVTLASDNTTTIESAGANAVQLSIRGTILAGGNGIRLSDSGDFSADNNTVTVETTGSITSETFAGVVISGSNNAVVNNGEITTFRSTGITISGIAETDNRVVNNGLITINAQDIDSVFAWGIDVGGTNAEVINTGTILQSGQDGTGVRLSQSAGETGSLINTGSIIGDGLGVEGGEGDQLVVNSGTIVGDIDMMGGSDRIENSGAVTGDIRLGGDVDVYRGDGNSTVSGDVFGGLGDDRMFGGDNDDTLDGGSNDDKIRGRDGDDDLLGGSGEDNIRGNDGDDVIEGNQDNDELYGGRGDDEISGGSGNDTITGGTGNDILSGNSGADTFVFTRRSGEDEITDFKNNTDKLDLSAFDVSSRQDLTDAGAIIANGAGSIIDLTKLGGDGVIYIEDMSVSQWGNSDFVFA